jgi:hypothetical protein
MRAFTQSSGLNPRLPKGFRGTFHTVQLTISLSVEDLGVSFVHNTAINTALGQPGSHHLQPVGEHIP